MSALYFLKGRLVGVVRCAETLKPNHCVLPSLYLVLLLQQRTLIPPFNNLMTPLPSARKSPSRLTARIIGHSTINYYPKRTAKQAGPLGVCTGLAHHTHMAVAWAVAQMRHEVLLPY